MRLLFITVSHWARIGSPKAVQKKTPTVVIYSSLKRQCHKIVLNFFSWIEHIWVPDKKIVFAKIFAKNVTLLSVILRQVRFGAISHCAESDSTQYHTAPSQEIDMSENPKLSNTARSRLYAVWYCAESDSAQYHTARSFAGNNIVFAGLSLPWKGM